jgi:tetratricopeptide (TPR) repeat protein
MAIWGMGEIKLPKNILLGLAAVSIATYTLVCSNYLGYWQNTYKLFDYCLKNEPNAWALHANLHTAYGRDGKHEKAAEHLIEAIGILPDYEKRAKINWFDYFMMGKVFWKRGQAQQAFDSFKKSKHLIDAIPAELLTSETLPERTQLNDCVAAFNSGKPEACRF